MIFILKISTLNILLKDILMNPYSTQPLYEKITALWIAFLMTKKRLIYMNMPPKRSTFSKRYDFKHILLPIKEA